MNVQGVVNQARSLLDQLQSTLQGEPLRAITYGAAVIIYIIGSATGRIGAPDFPTALGQATAAAALLVTIVETARHYVSPSSETIRFK